MCTEIKKWMIPLLALSFSSPDRAISIETVTVKDLEITKAHCKTHIESAQSDRNTVDTLD